MVEKPAAQGLALEPRGRSITLFGIIMTPLPVTSTDQELIAYVDRWAGLLEQEDGFASDLTATFWIVLTDAGIVLRLNDIHVM